jgi:hypothetical protein
VKKAGCILVLFLPAILYIYYCYSRATRFESAGKAAVRLLEEDRRRTKPATLAEARRIAEENARLAKARDTQDIERLLKNQERRLAMQAAAQVAGEQAAVVSCRSVASNSTQQSESVAWWSVDFECRWPGDTLPNRTSVSVRLAKKTLGWTVD